MPLIWSNDTIIQLIEKRRILECLWNPKTEKFKCKNSKLCEESAAAGSTKRS